MISEISLSIVPLDPSAHISAEVSVNQSNFEIIKKHINKAGNILLTLPLVNTTDCIEMNIKNFNNTCVSVTDIVLDQVYSFKKLNYTKLYDCNDQLLDLSQDTLYLQDSYLKYKFQLPFFKIALNI